MKELRKGDALYLKYQKIKIIDIDWETKSYECECTFRKITYSEKLYLPISFILKTDFELVYVLPERKLEMYVDPETNQNISAHLVIDNLPMVAHSRSDFQSTGVYYLIDASYYWSSQREDLEHVGSIRYAEKGFRESDKIQIKKAIGNFYSGFRFDISQFVITSQIGSIEYKETLKLTNQEFFLFIKSIIKVQVYIRHNDSFIILDLLHFELP